VLDLTEKYKKQLETQTNPKSNLEPSPQQTDTSGFSFLGGLASGVKAVESFGDDVGDSMGDERKKKLAKRLMDMTEKLENLSNQIYHLQQRVEVLEKKVGM
jgi:archaellum component FlaC